MVGDSRVGEGWGRLNGWMGAGTPWTILVSHAAEETARYGTLEGALACLIEDFSLSGIRANPDHPSLFHGHQS